VDKGRDAAFICNTFDVTPCNIFIWI